jgi:hypothetical protein
MRLSAFFSLVALIAAVPAHAQFGNSNSLTLEITPENPRPYDTITVTPRSDLLDLSTARITVSVGGTVIENGGGVQRVPITLGGPGSVNVIRAQAVIGGQTYSTQVTLRPADVSLVLEPVSSVHPFYQGAPLIASTGRVRIIALPDLRTSPTTRLNPGTLIYTWRWGDQLLTDRSGIGRSTLEVTAPVRYRDADITVTVTNPDQTIVAESTTRVAAQDPLVRIYPADPLMGPDFDHALTGGFTLLGEEAAFRGVAYFFGAKPSLAWSINSQPASADREVTVRTTGNGQGSATLSLTALNSDTAQSATARLPVSFGGGRTNNIFGF